MAHAHLKSSLVQSLTALHARCGHVVLCTCIGCSSSATHQCRVRAVLFQAALHIRPLRRSPLCQKWRKVAIQARAADCCRRVGTLIS
jgi:hypothetical protein